jgi:hypothetical protein
MTNVSLATEPEWEVHDSAAMLDRVKPGWWKKIDLDTLNLASHRQCVLGQLYGSFDRGRVNLRDMVYGDWALSCFYGNRDREAWIAEIERRREGNSA